MASETYQTEGQDSAHRRVFASEFWLAQLEVRLSRIEYILARLEWSLRLILVGGCTALGLMCLALLRGF